MPTIVLTGGGTAGHVLPNLALLPSLKQKFDRIEYLGGNGVEKDLVTQAGLSYHQITTVKLRRKLTLKNFLIPCKLVKGIKEAKQILRTIRPDVVFSKGGFVALPVVWAASSLGIKVVAHESDMTMGLANRLTAKKCAVICTTFPLAKKYPNAVQTGAIIRREIYHGDRSKICFPNNGKPHLLVIGGSSGAMAINQAVWQALDQLVAKFNVLHLTGKGKVNTQKKHGDYQQIAYLDNPQDAFAWADLVLSRSGSGTVSELLALHKPVLYIPLPRHESRGDQIQNATYLQNLGVCEILWQENLQPNNLIQALQNTYQQRQKLITNCEKQNWIDGTDKIINYL